MTATATQSQPGTNVGDSTMLVLEDVNTYYGNIHALQGISLTVGRGEIVTLIGANGAGKTTTLKTISGLLHPRRGQGRSSRARTSPGSPHTASCTRASGTPPRAAGSSRG